MESKCNNHSPYLIESLNRLTETVDIKHNTVPDTQQVFVASWAPRRSALRQGFTGWRCLRMCS